MRVRVVVEKLGIIKEKGVFIWFKEIVRCLLKIVLVFKIF